MNLGLRELASFLAEHNNDQSLVLATVTATEGSSYRKPGAMMLIRKNNQFAGLISGGCLEGDLVEHAATVFKDGQPRSVCYDLSADDQAIWGLGLGCGGIVHLLLLRLDRDRNFGFLPGLFEALDRRSRCVLALAHQSSPEIPAGAFALATDAGEVTGDPLLYPSLEGRLGNWDSPFRYQYTGPSPAAGEESILLIRVEPSPRVLVCGAGPDAVPVARQVDALGWECVVVDHRGAYAKPGRFPASTQVVQLLPGQLYEEVDLKAVDAAIVMSHNLDYDATYLEQLATLDLAYLGLLGPRARRDQLQEQLAIEELSIHGPAGFDIGAELPESIALAVMAEIHAVLSKDVRDAGRN
jgi:xanthine/CO dehydrogenase XdhC/CoxF family maturation factor